MPSETMRQRAEREMGRPLDQAEYSAWLERGIPCRLDLGPPPQPARPTMDLLSPDPSSTSFRPGRRAVNVPGGPVVYPGDRTVPAGDARFREWQRELVALAVVAVACFAAGYVVGAGLVW